MKIKEFFKQAINSQDICKDILEHEVQIQMHSSDGKYIGNAFAIERCGYKFSPWLVNKDGTQGSLVLDIRMVPKEEQGREILRKMKERLEQLHVAATPDNEWIFSQLEDFCNDLEKNE